MLFSTKSFHHLSSNWSSFHSWKFCFPLIAHSPMKSASNTRFYSVFCSTHKPPCSSWQLAVWVHLYSIEWSCCWTVLREHFSSLTRLNSLVISLKFCLQLWTIIWKVSLTSHSVICLGCPRNCCLSSHQVLHSQKIPKTCRGHFQTFVLTYPLFFHNVLPVWVQIGLFCSLLTSIFMLASLWKMYQSRSN